MSDTPESQSAGRGSGGRKVEVLDDVIIRFAGDSGDGMQLTGTQFTNTSALQGNDLATFPDYPAEIRAPAGTLAGVSGFQVHFSSRDILTPGDSPTVLVAMNPAALKTNLGALRPGAMIIANTDKFKKRDLEKAEYASNPLEDGSLEGFQVVPVPISSLTRRAVEPFGLTPKQADRCKNFFALGMTYWLFHRDLEPTEKWVRGKFKEPFSSANLAALQAGWNYADTLEIFHSSYEVPPAKLPPGTYRNITGNHALALGFATAGKLAGRTLYLGAYPITPASDVLHHLARLKALDVITFQAEDEIAAMASTVGASYGGALAVTATSGPGLALKSEALGLALISELPLVVVDVQRGGPSTGLPTKTEQSDLNIAMFGRHGDAPLPVLAAATPSDCFDAAIEAARVAVKFMTPVILLSDGYLANGAEPWRLPDLDALEPIEAHVPTDPEGFRPYDRDPETLARPWAVPGMAGFEHRIGGLEKEDGTGNVSYDPDNHERMTRLRAEKVQRVQRVIPPVEVHGDDDGPLLVTWGGTFGAVRAAVDKARRSGLRAAHVHLRWLNPFPANLGEVLRERTARGTPVVVAELNTGQLAAILRARYEVPLQTMNKIAGQPFRVSEVLARIQTLASTEEATR